MEFGVDTWIGYPALDLEEILLLLEAEGFRYIEYAYFHFQKLEEEGDLEELEEYISMIHDITSTTTLRPLQLHAPFGDLQYLLSSADERERSRAIDIIARWIRYTSILETPIIVVHVAFTRPHIDKTYNRVVEKLVEINISNINTLLKCAREYGVKIALENTLERWFGASPEDLILLIENTDPDYVGICFDTGHANVNRFDLGKFIERASRYIIATHVHDNDRIHDNHNPPFMGSINWEKVIKAFKQVRYPYPLLFEVVGDRKKEVVQNRVKLLRIISETLKTY